MELWFLAHFRSLDIVLKNLNDPTMETTEPLTKSMSKWNDFVREQKSVFSVLSVLQYSQLDQLSVSSVNYAEEDGKLLPLVICKKYYRQGHAEHSEGTYDIDAQTESGYYCHSFFF